MSELFKARLIIIDILKPVAACFKSNWLFFRIGSLCHWADWSWNMWAIALTKFQCFKLHNLLFEWQNDKNNIWSKLIRSTLAPYNKALASWFAGIRRFNLEICWSSFQLDHHCWALNNNSVFSVNTFNIMVSASHARFLNMLFKVSADWYWRLDNTKMTLSRAVAAVASVSWWDRINQLTSSEQLNWNNLLNL